MPKELYAQGESPAEVASAVLNSAGRHGHGRDVYSSSTDEEPARITPRDAPVVERATALNRTLAGALWVTALLAGTLLAVSGVGKLASLPIFAGVLKELFSLGSTASSLLSVGVAALELSAGVTLIVHPRERFPSAVGAVLFTIFCVIQVRLAAMGSTTECGCFGILQGSWLHRATQNHLTMLVVDAAITATLSFDALSRASKHEPEHKSIHHE